MITSGKVHYRRSRLSAVLVVSGLLICTAAWGGQLQLRSGTTITGKISYKRQTKQYVVTTKEGNQLQFGEGQVRAVLLPMPEEYKQAKKNVERKNYGGAIAGLEKIVKTHHKLYWDMQAKVLLAEAYFGARRAAKALDLCEELLGDRSIRVPARINRLYLEALIADEQFEKADEQIVRIIGSGPRAAAAAAQIFRGNLLMEQEKYHEALVKGYLRTVELYRDVAAVQPEALFLTAKCLVAMDKKQEAAAFRKRLLEEFPRSEYAKKMRGGK